MTTAQTATFATRLRRYRREAGLTQEALAERASISLRAVSDLERGVYRTPHPDTVQLLAQALGLAPHDAAQLEAAVVRGRGPVKAPNRPGDRLSPTLPVQLTSFVGREHEAAAVAHLLLPWTRTWYCKRSYRRVNLVSGC